jgi:HAD superfamily hydrolase (TIGR01509 family)
VDVVFDLGGVVFTWRPVELVGRVLPHRVTDDDSARRWVEAIFEGYGGDWQAFDRGTVEVPALVQRIAARTGLTTTEVRAVVEAVPVSLTPIAATVDLLREVKAAGHRLLYLSNMPAPYADHLERVHDFFDDFEDGVFSSRVHKVKPEADIFDHALEQFGVQAGDCVFLDDHLPNVEAARSLGWQAHLFTQADAARRDLQAMGLLSLPG